jgi:hypothetical protein
MKKTAVTVLAGLMLISIFAVSAAASPTAPRARVVAPTAPRASSEQSTATPSTALICFQLGRPKAGNNKYWCVLGNKGPAPSCTRVFGLDGLISYWRCGRNDKPPTPGGCINLAGNKDYTCFGKAKPEGTCVNAFSVLFIHRYYCTSAGAKHRRLPQL